MTTSTPHSGNPRSIERMFADVAPRYDLLNSLLSLGRHHRWRSRAAELAGVKPGGRALDICCGTGDMALALARRAGPTGLVVGTDFCEPMLRLGQAKSGGRQPARLCWIVGDATSLPASPETFDCATVAFGVRNVSDMATAFREAFRVLKPGGIFVCLEFSLPRHPLVRGIVRAYEATVIPMLGALFSNGAAYQYLPRSIRSFPVNTEVLAMLRDSGFAQASSHAMHLGSVVAYRGVRS